MAVVVVVRPERYFSLGRPCPRCSARKAVGGGSSGGSSDRRSWLRQACVARRRSRGRGAAGVLEKVGVAVVVGRRSWVGRLSCAVGGCPCDVGSMQAVLALACGLACGATRPVQRTAEGGRGERQGQRQREARWGVRRGCRGRRWAFWMGLGEIPGSRRGHSLLVRSGLVFASTTGGRRRLQP
jgi:hypothetical protein